MKKLVTVICMLMTAAILFAQSIDTLVQEGADNYNVKNYKTAYEKFKAAMKINPNHSEASRWYWKMKKEFDVANLTDSGSPVGQAAITEGTQNPITQNSSGSTQVKVPVNETRTVYVKGETDNTKIKELDKKLSLMQSLLKSINSKQESIAEKKSSEQTNQSSSINDSNLFRMIIIVPIALTVFILLFMVLLVFTLKKKRNKYKDYYNAHLQEEMLNANMRINMMNTVPSMQSAPALPGRSPALMIGGPSSSDTALVPYGAAPGVQGEISSSDPDFFKFESFANGYVYLLDKKYKRGDNTRKIKTLANEIGMQIAMTHEEILELRIIAMLRDIGFLMIPESIILKKSGLSKQESMEIFRHPFYSSEMMKAMNMPERLVQSVVYHHERFDGSGYPNGLKGDEIPVYARIVGLCESYVSLTSEKPYKKALSSDEAIEVLNSESHLFDKELLKILTNIAKENM